MLPCFFVKNTNRTQCSMAKQFKGCIAFVVVLVYLFSSFSSCIDPKTVTYFNNLPDAKNTQLDSLKVPEPIILINDVLEIRVGGESEETVKYYNGYLTGTSGNVTIVPQFVVDVNGNIELPKIGKLKMAGLTREQARDTLTAAYKQYLVDPIVSVKFSNFRFSVLGEVKVPGTFSTLNDKLSIFEALALAGDITEFGRFDDVKIIRDVNGKRSITSVNLLDKNILNADEYYIHRYDIIFVKTRRLKSATENFNRTTTILATLTSLIAILLVLFKK